MIIKNALLLSLLAIAPALLTAMEGTNHQGKQEENKQELKKIFCNQDHRHIQSHIIESLFPTIDDIKKLSCEEDAQTLINEVNDNYKKVLCLARGADEVGRQAIKMLLDRATGQIAHQIRECSLNTQKLLEEIEAMTLEALEVFLKTKTKIYNINGFTTGKKSDDDPFEKDRSTEGKNPLSYIIMGNAFGLPEKNKKIFKTKLLLENGANPDAIYSSFYEHTPLLILALERSEFKIAKLLLKAGANPKAEKKSRLGIDREIFTVTALFTAGKQTQIIQLLHEYVRGKKQPRNYYTRRKDY